MKDEKKSEEKDHRIVDGRSNFNTGFYSSGIHDQVKNMIKTSTRKSLKWNHVRQKNSALTESDVLSELLYQALEIRESSSGTSVEDEAMNLDRIKEDCRSDSMDYTYAGGVWEESEYIDVLSNINNAKIETPVINSSAKNRLLCDFNRLQCQSPSGVLAAPVDGNIMRWQGVIFGHDGTPWEGGIFSLNLEFTDNYPFKPPVVYFLTEMFHPNIGPNGDIYFDMLGKCWTPAYDIMDVLKSNQSLLSQPSYIIHNTELSALLTQNMLEYNCRVRETVKKSLAEESCRHSI